MNAEAWIRAAALYLPLMAAALSRLLAPRRPRQFAALLLSFLWVAVTLMAVQRLNQVQCWWIFSGPGANLCGMPLELYLGWAILWGVVPQIAFFRIKIGWVAGTFSLIDLLVMPLCEPVVRLLQNWLLGEAVCVAVVLLPALCISRWTEGGTHLKARAGLQTVIASLLFFFLVPEIVFALRPGSGWLPLLHLPGWQLQLGLQVTVLLALPGLAAVMEFATRGSGTPIPYDPPQSLVTSGIYRYLANPMQVSCTLAMACWAGLLHNGWLFFAAAMSGIYSAGIANWDERRDLHQRFGNPWLEYRNAVHNWLPRWRPFHAGVSARLYIASSCGPCTEVRLWLEARHPVGLEILDAETLPSGSIRRMRYDPRDGTRSVDGVRALGHALEHLHLLWAIAGAALRLPVVWQSVQLVMDASGLGPRSISAYTCVSRNHPHVAGETLQGKMAVLPSASTPNDR